MYQDAKKILGLLLLASSFVMPLAPQETSWNELNAQVIQLYQQGKYAEAVPLAQESLHVAEATFGAQHLEVAESLNNLAFLYYEQGRYPEAEPLFQRALAIKEKALGPDHPAVATSLNNLGLLYKEQGRYAAAEPLFQRALAIDEKALGPEHPDVATDLNNLAGLYDKQGRYAEAEPLFQRALAIKAKVIGPDHPTVASSLNNLAQLYKEQGRYADAEPLFRRALAIDEKAFGPEHPRVATDLDNLAFLYYKQGRYAEAEPLYRRAVVIDEKALGPEHPGVATDLDNLALLYKEEGRYAEAEPLFHRALAIKEKALGPDHPAVATSLNNLALLYEEQRRYAEAEPLFRRALAIDEKALGPEHARVATDLNNLAELYEKQERYAEAEQLYKRALAIKEKPLGRDHPAVVTSLNNLAIPTILVWDAKTGRTLLALNERKPVVSLVFSPDGRRLASYAQDGRISIWDAASGQALLVIPAEEELIGSIVFSPDGHFIVGASLGSVTMWESTSGLLVRKWMNALVRTALTFSPDGRILALAGSDSSIWLWDVRSGQKITTLSPQVGAIDSLAFSRDGRFLASGNDHNTAYVWDLSGHSEPLELVGHSGSVLAVEFSPDSKLLATGSADRTCKIWDVKSGAEIRTLRGHTLSVIALAFDPTGRALVTGSQDHTSKVWETSTWREVRTIYSMQGVVSSLALSPDGTKIASGTTLAHLEETNIHILAIGINQYRHREFNLRFSVSDATALAQAFQQGAKGLFARVDYNLLTDEIASRLKIIAAFQSIAKEARPSDTFIFYFAGHGVAEDGEYFLLPSDAELGDKSDLAAVRGAGISSRELKIWLSKITARQQLVLLDTADSASAFEALDSRFEHKSQELSELLGRNLVIMGSLSAQFYFEPGRFSHGLLAYELLDGLTGKAANPSDGTVTARQLASFVSKQISILTDGKAHGVNSFIGDDFPIARTQVPTAPHTTYHSLGHLQQTAYAFRLPLKDPFTFPEPSGQDQQSSPSNRNSELRGFSSEPTRVSPTPNIPPRKDYAVLFATNDYDDSSHWHHLTNPIDDAKTVADDLHRVYGFDVLVVPNPKQDEIFTTLRGYVKKQYGPEDQLLVFFAGHGAYDEDFQEGYVVARDSQAGDQNRHSYISYSDLRTILDNMSVKHVLLVLDTCFGGTFDPKWPPGQSRGDDLYVGMSREQFVHEKLQYVTRRYITSGGKEYVPDGRPGQHSPFVRAFLEALRTYGGSNGFLTTDGVYEHMQLLRPGPHRNDFGKADPGSDFLFVTKLN